MAKKKVTKIECDFCSREIEKGERSVTEKVYLGGNANDEAPQEFKNVLVDIRLSWTSGKRFNADACSACIYRAAQLAAAQGLGEGQLTETL